MAGSIKWFTYTTDANVVYGIKLDESNTEAVNGATGDYTDATSAVTDALPRNIKPRCAYYVNSTRTRTIKCVILTPTIYATISLGGGTIADPIAGTGNLVLNRLVGEKRSLPFPQDTGLDDGDAT